MDETSEVFECESLVQDAEPAEVTSGDIPTSENEFSLPSFSAHLIQRSGDDRVVEVTECDKKEYSECLDTIELREEGETSEKNHSENSEGDASKSSADDAEDRRAGLSTVSETNDTEDRRACPSTVSETDDAFMIVDVGDDTDKTVVPPQVPHVDFKSIPCQITGVWKEFEHMKQNNFTKGCKWSPDGSCLLSCSEDSKMRLFNLPLELYQMPINWTDVSEMFSVLKVSEAELIYDYCWYPLMSSVDPVSCCFVSSSRYNPVHMWDAFTGELRCTYRSYNHLDEIVTAYGLAFDSDGQKLYCGFKNMIRIFNVSVPGRNFQTLPTCVKKYGQKGIISCFAFSAENRSIFAAGSYSKTVGIYSETDSSLIHLLGQQQGGVTHLCFSPDGCQLYCGGRNDPEIQCWDMRNMKKPLFLLRRICNTNQRMYFDISRCGQYVASGNNNGVVTVWDVKDLSKQVHVGESVILEPVQFYQAHNDCVNGISFHPNLPLLATSSGQRQFPELLDSEGEENDCEMFTDKHILKDNSIRLWWTGSSVEH